MDEVRRQAVGKINFKDFDEIEDAKFVLRAWNDELASTARRRWKVIEDC